MLVNIKVTGGLNIESGQNDPKATGGLNCLTLTGGGGEDEEDEGDVSKRLTLLKVA